MTLTELLESPVTPEEWPAYSLPFADPGEASRAAIEATETYWRYVEAREANAEREIAEWLNGLDEEDAFHETDDRIEF
jgi:hypothetical protein